MMSLWHHFAVQLNNIFYIKIKNLVLHMADFTLIESN